MFGTNPSGDTSIILDGECSMNKFSRWFRSQDRSSKLQSHMIGSIPNNIGELTSVAQLKLGMIIFLFFNLPGWSKAASANKIAEDPEFK